MPQREFDITIGKDGSVELHVKGYKGKGCLEAMKMFEQIVGELKEEQQTSEYSCANVGSAFETMSKATSPYYPPRARWYSPAFYLLGAARRNVGLERIHLPPSVTWGGLC